MTQGVKTYDPANVQIIMGGVPITGFADGTFIEISPTEDAYTRTVGADGEVSRSRSNNRTADVTITLKQTSSSNDALSAFYLADQQGNNGVVPLMVKEIGSGRTLEFTQAAWVQRAPNTTYAKEISDRAWTIGTANMQRFIGGNSTTVNSEV